MVGHREEGDRAAGVAAVADGRHVSIPHDRHGGQRLAGGVRMHNGVALPSRRGQLGAQRQVLLYLLVLALVEVELGVFQVVMYLQQQQIIHKLSSLRRKMLCGGGGCAISKQCCARGVRSSCPLHRKTI